MVSGQCAHNILENDDPFAPDLHLSSCILHQVYGSPFGRPSSALTIQASCLISSHLHVDYLHRLPTAVGRMHDSNVFLKSIE
jgi:hypothetical protein